MIIEQGKLEPFGVPIDRFCPRDQERIVSMVRSGKIGIAGLCVSCTALVDAARPAQATPPTEHPAPWRWIRGEEYRPSLAATLLVDADGEHVLWTNTDDDIEAASHAVRELIRLAPTMEALLRRALVDLRTLDIAEGGVCGPAESRADVEALLAAVDAARAVKP